VLERRHEKSYAAAQTWLFVMDNSAIGLYQEILNVTALQQHARRILGSKFKRVYVLQHCR
jgi:hypothetical protein